MLWSMRTKDTYRPFYNTLRYTIALLTLLHIIIMFMYMIMFDQEM